MGKEWTMRRIRIWNESLGIYEIKSTPRVSFLFAWYDLWVGAFWDRKSRKLYILPVPCVGIVVQF